MVHHVAVGISKYDRAKLALQYADSDARQLADAFTAAAKAGTLYRPEPGTKLLEPFVGEVPLPVGPADRRVDDAFAARGAFEASAVGMAWRRRIDHRPAPDRGAGAEDDTIGTLASASRTSGRSASTTSEGTSRSAWSTSGRTPARA